MIYFVIISKPTTLLKADSKNTNPLQKIIHLYVVSRIEKTKSDYREKLLNTKKLMKIVKTIMKEDVQEEFDPLSAYNLTVNDISKGIMCSHCRTTSMIFHYGKWMCLNCNHRDSNAHVEALADYFLLFNDTPISNKLFREFIQLPSSYTANRLLSSMKLRYTGEKSGRRYYPTKRRSSF